jgi:hypothetical protein
MEGCVEPQHSKFSPRVAGAPIVLGVDRVARNLGHTANRLIDAPASAFEPMANFCVRQAAWFMPAMATLESPRQFAAFI